MLQAITPDELRKVAGYVEETALAALDEYSDITFPLVIGGAQYFPRESPENRATEQGFAVLRTGTEQVVAALYALAAVMENNREVPPVLLALVQPYITAFHAERTEERKSLEGAERESLKGTKEKLPR